MLAGDLADKFRRFISDVEEPYLLSDEDLYDIMGEAQDEFLSETHCMQETLGIPVFAGKREVAIPNYVIKVRHAYLSTDGRVIKPRTVEQMQDATISDYGVTSAVDWTTASTDMNFIVLDLPRGTGVLVGAPSRNDTLKMVVTRRQKTAIEDFDSEVEILGSWHRRALLYGMAGLAYQMQDADLFDSDGASRNLTLFYAEIDKSRHRCQRRGRPAGTVRYGGL